ncbi:MAG TPA: hypothetical protein V6C84_00360 [Coleofasciculaceae cyanobacterium]
MKPNSNKVLLGDADANRRKNSGFRSFVSQSGANPLAIAIINE